MTVHALRCITDFALFSRILLLRIWCLFPEKYKIYYFFHLYNFLIETVPAPKERVHFITKFKRKPPRNYLFALENFLFDKFGEEKIVSPKSSC